MSDIKDFVIRNGVLKKYVGDEVNVIVPDEVKEIGTSAFKECKKIETIVLPDGLETIGGRAFLKCFNLKAINLPQSLQKVGMEVFQDCHSLEDLIFPEHTCLTRCPIDNCWNLKTVVFPSVYKGERKFITGCNKLAFIVAPGIAIDFFDAKYRMAAACGYIKYHEKFNKGDIIASYNSYLLKQKSKLLPVIWECDAVQILNILAENAKITKQNIESEYVQPASTTNALKCTAFLLEWKNQKLKTNEASDAFIDDLDKVSEYDEIKKLWSFEKAEDGTLILSSYKGSQTDIIVPANDDKGNTVSQLKQYLLSPWTKDVRYGGQKARPKAKFEIMKRIEKITIEEGIKTIGEGAFYSCLSLKEVLLPQSLEYIESYAFHSCDRLTSISIPGNVKKISIIAFLECENLTIHAPAGSYAEQYAKENNIKFVAE